GWPYLAGRADFIDYVWLQLIKLKRYDLYVWVRNYLVSVGSYRDGGQVSDGEPEKQGQKLVEILKNLEWEGNRGRIAISYFLPGIKYDPAIPKVFDFSENELGALEAGMRLGSPTHWRRYFSFALPSYAVTDEDIDDFLSSLVKDSSRASEI